MVWRPPDDTTDDIPGYTRPLPERGQQEPWQQQPGQQDPWQQQPGQQQPGQRPRKPVRPRPSRKRRYLKRAAITLVTLVVVFLLGVGALLLVTPSAGEAPQLAQQEAQQHGIAYPGPPVPQNFARPLVATEDHRFYSEPGVDLLAVGRVVGAKLTGGQDQGGATIEQQLAKLLYTPGQSGITAELKQVALAVKLNHTYSKQQILQMYAEVAYYGHGYYGLEQASCGYFGHPAGDLTVVQGAMLAGVVNAPSVDDPINNPDNAHARLTHVIERMVAVGDLTQAQANTELSTPLGIVPRDQAGC